MSYDVTFIPKRPDQTWEEALRANEERVAAEAEPTPIDAALRARYGRVGTEVAKLLPGLRVTEGPSFVELTDERSGLQLSLYAAEAALSVPYWHEGDDAEAVLQQMQALARVVELETGWQAYDPQQDRAFLGAADTGEVAREMSRLTRFVQNTIADGADAPSKRPWWRFW